MRLKEIKSGDYDPAEKALTIRGTNMLGKDSEVVLPVANPTSFVSWSTSVLQSSPGDRSGLVADGMGFSVGSAGGRSWTAFIFHIAGGGVLRFAVPIEDAAQSNLEAIRSHLNEAMRLMGMTQTAAAQG